MFKILDAQTGLESINLELKDALTLQVYMELTLNHDTVLVEVR